MIHLKSCRISWNDQQLDVPLGKKTFLDDCYLDFTREERNQGVRYQLQIHPKVNLQMNSIKAHFSFTYEKDSQVFCNGFQSWTSSRNHGIQESIPKLRKIGRPFFKYYGDENNELLQNNYEQRLHSWTYGYVSSNKHIHFIGSLNEKTGFTLINYTPNINQITAEIDCKGLELQHSFPILDIWVASGKEKSVLERYFSEMNTKTAPPKVTGWTSWYQHYTNINEQIILDNLLAFKSKEIPLDFFQIDDGYQKKVGDWLDVDQEKFPNGMGMISRSIRNAGYQPGIWIAPFVCSKDSTIFKNQPSWILKDKKGKPIKVGYNPLWGGWYYALDFYQVKFQEYLIGVFHTLTQKWNFDLVKIDFLFAACIAPPINRTAGQVMNDAMTFIRTQVGNKKIIGCGVPLGSAFGMVDYCRIGADIHLEWEHKLLNFLRKRERVSCRAAMRSIFSRWSLDGQAFGNDPDVILLRQDGNKLSAHQKQSILRANALLGSLVFTSDNPNQWTAEETDSFLSIKKLQEAKVHEVNQLAIDQYEIIFSQEDVEKTASFNLTDRKIKVKEKDGEFVLAPFESKIN